MNKLSGTPSAIASDASSQSAKALTKLRKKIFLLVSLSLIILIITSLPYWIRKPFTPLERLDFWQPEGINIALKSLTYDAMRSTTPTVYSLYQPGCWCNLISMRHELSMEAYAVQLGAHFKRIDASTLNLPSTPALAIVSPNGTLEYFGAYGFGSFCTDSKLSYAESKLKQLFQGKTLAPLYNIKGSGCFCRPSR